MTGHKACTVICCSAAIGLAPSKRNRSSRGMLKVTRLTARGTIGQQVHIPLTQDFPARHALGRCSGSGSGGASRGLSGALGRLKAVRLPGMGSSASRRPLIRPLRDCDPRKGPRRSTASEPSSPSCCQCPSGEGLRGVEGIVTVPTRRPGAGAAGFVPLSADNGNNPHCPYLVPFTVKPRHSEEAFR